METKLQMLKKQRLKTPPRIHVFSISHHIVLVGGVKDVLMAINTYPRNSWSNCKIWQRDSKCETIHKIF